MSLASVNQALVAAVGEEKMAEGHLMHPLALTGASGISSLGLESPDSPVDKSKDDKLKRRKVTKACLYCQKSHMSCDKERPCKRCIQRNIPNLCRDMDGKRRGRKGTYLVSDVPNAKPLVTDNQGEQFSFNQPSMDILFTAMEDITHMLYTFERNRAIEEETKSEPRHSHVEDIAKASEDPSKQVTTMFWQWLQAKLPAQMHNDISTTRNEFETQKRKLLVGRVLLEPELAACKEDLQAQLKAWRSTFLPLEVPFITWGRDFRIYDYNKTFTEICGQIPPVSDHEANLLRLLSVTSIVRFFAAQRTLIAQVNLLRAQTHLLKTPGCDVTNFACSWQVQIQASLSYLEGVCWLVVRRDPLGFPMVFMGVFTPINPMSGAVSLRDPK